MSSQYQLWNGCGVQTVPYAGMASGLSWREHVDTASEFGTEKARAFPTVRLRMDPAPSSALS